MNDRSEQEQLEELKSWWQENRWHILGGLALGIAVMVGWNVWQDQREGTRLAASAAYEAFVDEVADGDVDAASGLAEDLFTRYDGTPYASQARLAMARLYMDRGRDQDAANVLRPLATGGDEVLALIARHRLARILLYQDRPQEVLDLLGAAAGDTAFEARFNELRGDAHRALGDIGAANDAYRAVLADAGASQTVNTGFVRMKLDDLPQPSADKAAGADDAGGNTDDEDTE